MYIVHGSNNRDTPGNVLYTVETHCLCELLNRYVIIDKYAIVSALLFSQSEQKVKSGICTINHKTCTKGLRKKKFVCFQSLSKLHNKATYGASGFCKNYTTKTPLYILHYKQNRKCRLHFCGGLLYCECTR